MKIFLKFSSLGFANWKNFIQLDGETFNTYWVQWVEKISRRSIWGLKFYLNHHESDDEDCGLAAGGGTLAV